MRDIDYLKLLSRQYSTPADTAAGIVKLRAMCSLPRGAEYFFSDLHGEHEAFRHMLRSCSGNVLHKVKEAFEDRMPDEEQRELAYLIAYPERALLYENGRQIRSREWQRERIIQLTKVASIAGRGKDHMKYIEKYPDTYTYIISEFLSDNERGDVTERYYQEMLDAILDTGYGYECITQLCIMTRELLMEHVHILGDIFDRGPRADLILNDLEALPKVDIQWGNHDIYWMGAALGNDACIATVLRIATFYNSFDVLEDGYGINIRPLCMFAQRVYGKDPCERFMPHLLDENEYDIIKPELVAKMCKAITIIEFKLEGQLIHRHPEYKMEDRLLLDKIDYEKGEITIDGKTYPLLDKHFPTIDPNDPYKLTTEEFQLVNILRYSFLHANRLQRHLDFLFAHGSTYKIVNNNLLLHGCVPVNEDGSLMQTTFLGETYAGEKLLKEIDRRCRKTYFSGQRHGEQRDILGGDLFWYLWCGAQSPLFGKHKMATFEGYFLADPKLKVENYNPYYKKANTKTFALKLMDEFGIDKTWGHIINGHVPVKVKKGETPVKAGGKVYFIDGGISKAYQKRTGIAGYTLISTSRRLALAQHQEFIPGREVMPETIAMEMKMHRVRIAETDEGKKYLELVHDLEELLHAYREGLIKPGTAN